MRNRVQMTLVACIASLGLLSVVTPSRAQVPPTASEIAAYQGLHRAAASGDLNALNAVLATKPDLEARDGRGRTALHIAAHASAYDKVRALVAAGANVRALDSQRYDIITIAAVKDDAAMVDLAISLGGDPKAITSLYDGTALIAAAHLGHDGVIRSLIKAGASLDHVNNLTWTAVIEAIVLGDGGPRHQASLKALVEAGAKISIPDKAGVMPLQMAEQRGYTAMVQILKSAPRR
ncbi:MAG: ankyrin repeat domain-containing protein [Hyphomicrobiaceae bacterium]|nr:ankyrin repeat domain-containing protein [Hyphomicrobiaceae bacterium]